MVDPALYLYGTQGCHLCDLAEQVLVATLENAPDCICKVDISDSDALIERYGTSIPVVRAQTGTGDWLELLWPFDQAALIHYLNKLE